LGSFPPILFLAITPADTATHLCGVFGGGPVSVGQAIEGDTGAEAEPELWAETTTEAAVKARTERSKGRIIFRSLTQHLRSFWKKLRSGSWLLAHWKSIQISTPDVGIEHLFATSPRETHVPRETKGSSLPNTEKS
jgi:hypothetical protein